MADAVELTTLLKILVAADVVVGADPSTTVSDEEFPEDGPYLAS
jgi:hypothetical protein